MSERVAIDVENLTEAQRRFVCHVLFSGRFSRMRVADAVALIERVIALEATGHIGECLHCDEPSFVDLEDLMIHIDGIHA